MYIKIYTQNGCLHCDRIKSFLKENKLVYYEKNISENKEHYQDLLRLGYPVVPVTLINGKKYVGFDEEVKKALLKGVDL